MAEFETIDDVIEVTNCFGCPMSVTTGDEGLTINGYECGLDDDVEVTGWDEPPPIDCPLRCGEVVVRLRAIGGET